MEDSSRSGTSGEIVSMEMRLRRRLCELSREKLELNIPRSCKYAFLLRKFPC